MRERELKIYINKYCEKIRGAEGIPAAEIRLKEGCRQLRTWYKLGKISDTSYIFYEHEMLKTFNKRADVSRETFFRAIKEV